MLTHTMFVYGVHKILPKSVYQVAILASGCTVYIPVLFVIVGIIHERLPMSLVVSDQIYFVESNIHHVISVVHEYMTGCVCMSIPLP
ncbi:MAG: hypothetical protein WCP92_08470 [bacterium]